MILQKIFNYLIQYFKFILKTCLIRFLLIPLSIYAADDKKTPPPSSNTPNTGSSPQTPVYIPPLPRHMEFPTISYAKEPTVEGEAEINVAKMHFWYVLILATWNPRSAEITDIINKNFKTFSQRNVGVIGLFSNDSLEAVNIWRKKYNPQFLNEFASRNLLDALKNPKIPSVWVIGNQGEVLQRLEMPTREMMLESVQKVMILTGY
ncbi:hypothetical protein QEJ31_03535 [Pigmentibacter sp. JX0631]|uniref:hypothetical protein n=1 Tax=Pigmentibacter sp. JX0631 TaxID=2976982 RepID=UPI00246902CA|nr:hypothetical protein [Pigmentibacter sp. JX0631]WGL60674.1 hypothetical protein QEJ31_03535 [Pigmentibacter sp. JX0631]